MGTQQRKRRREDDIYRAGRRALEIENKARGEVADLTRKVILAQDQVGELNATLSKKDVTIAQLARKNDELEKRVDDLVKGSGLLQVQLERSYEAADAVTAERDELRSQVESFKQEIARIQSEDRDARKLRKELKKVRERLQAAKEQVAAKNTEISRIKQQNQW